MTQSEQHRLLMEATAAQHDLQEAQRRVRIGTRVFDHQIHQSGLGDEFLLQQQLAASAAPTRDLSIFGGNYTNRSATGNALDQQLLLRHRQLQLSEQRHNEQLLLRAEQRTRQLMGTATTLPARTMSALLLQQERQRRQLLQAQLDTPTFDVLVNTQRAGAEDSKEAQDDSAGRQGERNSS